MRKQPRIIAAGLAAVLLLSLTACGGASKENADEESSSAQKQTFGSAVQVQRVTAESIATDNKVSGRVLAEDEATIMVGISAKCVAVYKDAGDAVREGDILCKLDLASTLSQYNASQIGYESAIRSYNDQKALFEQQIAVAQKNVSVAEEQIDVTRKQIEVNEKQIPVTEQQIAVQEAQIPVLRNQITVQEAQIPVVRQQIEAAEDGEALMKLDLIASTYRQKNVPVSGTAIYYGETELTDGFTVEYSLGQGTDYEKILVQHFPATLQPGDQMRFTLDDTFELPFHEAVTYNATITADQNRYSTEGRLTSYPRRVVCEEGTGTWCGWCVRGLVALDSLNKHCNDWTIGIAAHQGDPMANSYIEHLTYYLDSGYPAGNVCRSVRTDPGKFPSVALQVYNGIETLVAMQTEATTNFDNRTVSCSTNLWFADNYDAADFRLGYVVIENNVHVPGDSRYNQNNAYSGGKSGPMGGYENKPSPVPSDEMWYQEVARAYVDDFNGVAGSVPAQIVADETISFDKEFALPDGILNDRNCELVVMLINQTDESIVNAVKVKLRGEGEATGIEEMSQHPTTNCSEKIYDLQGRQVDAAAAKGLYIKGGRKYVCTGRK